MAADSAYYPLTQSLAESAEASEPACCIIDWAHQKGVITTGPQSNLRQAFDSRSNHYLVTFLPNNNDQSTEWFLLTYAKHRPSSSIPIPFDLTGHDPCSFLFRL
jgi:hypothetical protein